MEESHLDFRSRLGARAVTAGVATSFALLILLGTLCGGLGFWDFNLFGPPQLYSGFWISSTIAWIISSFCGAFVAAVGSRSSTARNGALHGLVTWAASSLFGFLVLVIGTRSVFGNDFSEATSADLLSVFFGNLLALGAALAGGRRGARSEAELARENLNKESEHRLAA
jgi:hypothetical protein